jgi:hypothetical protein
LSQNWRRSNIDEVVRDQVELDLCGTQLYRRTYEKTHHPINPMAFAVDALGLLMETWRGRIALASEQANLLQGNINQLTGGC